MSSFNPVKEEEFREEAGVSGSYPKISIACLHDQDPPAFLTKTYDIVDDPTIDRIVSWSCTGSSFVVWDTHAFAMDLIPRFFKHNNFCSFVRQLNSYVRKFVLAHLLAYLITIHLSSDVCAGV